MSAFSHRFQLSTLTCFWLHLLFDSCRLSRAANLDRGNIDIDRSSIFVGQLNQALITRALVEEKFGKYGTIVSPQLINRFPPGQVRTSLCCYLFNLVTCCELYLLQTPGQLLLI